MSNYVIYRPAYAAIQIKEFFTLTGDYNLTVSTPDTSKGYVRVNTLDIKSSTKGLPENTHNWTGVYYDNIPLNITAVPIKGYKFSHWIYNGNQYLDSTITINTSTNRSYTAYFEPAILSNNPIRAVAADLIKCGYSLTKWEANNEAGSSPRNSKFVYLDMEDPTISAQIEGFTSGLYNYTKKTRISGLDTLGFSFINTTSSPINPGYPNAKLGGFLLALNTMHLDTVKLSWTARTITANPRKYRLRLYYREGDVQDFKDFSPVIEYNGNVVSGHEEIFSNIKLPSEILNKPYVQLFWKYYFTGEATSSSRDELAIDDILIKGSNRYSGALTANIDASYSPNNIYNDGKVLNGYNIYNYAKDGITLLPGFKAETGSVYKAEIKICE